MDVTAHSWLACQARPGQCGPEPVVPPFELAQRRPRAMSPVPTPAQAVCAKQAAGAQSGTRPTLTSKLSRHIHPELLPIPSSPLSFLHIQQHRAGKQPVIKASWEGGRELQLFDKAITQLRRYELPLRMQALRRGSVSRVQQAGG